MVRRIALPLYLPPFSWPRQRGTIVAVTEVHFNAIECVGAKELDIAYPSSAAFSTLDVKVGNDL